MKIVNGALLKVEQDDIIDGCFSVPDGVAIIAPSAFVGCSSLERVRISADVTMVSPLAFYGCENLAIVNFEENSRLKRIDKCAFESCENLKDIVIPASVFEIGAHAFKNCTQLTTVDFEPNNRIELIGAYAFQNCHNLSSINLGRCSQLTAVMSTAFENCSSLSKIELPAQTALPVSFFKFCPAEVIRTNVKKLSLKDRIASAHSRTNTIPVETQPRRETQRNPLESLKYEP